MGWLSRLPELNGVRCYIVLGSLNLHLQSVDALISQSNLEGKVYTALSAKEMLDLMCNVDFAITAAGSTVWEYMKASAFCLQGYLKIKILQSKCLSKKI